MNLQELCFIPFYSYSGTEHSDFTCNCSECNSFSVCYLPLSAITNMVVRQRYVGHPIAFIISNYSKFPTMWFNSFTTQAAFIKKFQ